MGSEVLEGMGCSQSAPDNQWAYKNQAGHGLEKPMAVVAPQLSQLNQLRTFDMNQLSQIGQDGEVDRATIEEYVELEKKIAGAETHSPALILQQKKDQLGHLDERIKQQEQSVAALQDQTKKEKKDVEDLEIPETKRLFLEQNTLDAKKSKEQKEYLDALNKEEIATQELANLNEQKASLELEIDALVEQSTDLHSLYARQDELLKRIFGGEYGSVEENQLEESLDQHEEMRNRIVEANFKWKQAQLMVDYAFKQLNEAVTKWKSLTNIDPGKLEERYGVASIARNNLVASAQNIQGAQRYLSNVQFPYCAPSEVATLNKATAYIFTDMQTPERHQHALDCYSTTAKRCGALLQWINQVVNNTIAKDLDDINKKVKDASMGLRRERIRLIKIKAKEITGQDIELEAADIDTDVNVEVNLNELARTEGIDPSILATLTPAQLAAINSISDDDLAPPPSEEDIFGKTEALKQQFAEDNDRIAQQMAENEARVKNNMAAKLAERRQRRARMNLEERETAALTGKPIEDAEEHEHEDEEDEHEHEEEHKEKKHRDKKHKKHKDKKHKDKKHK